MKRILAAAAGLVGMTCVVPVVAGVPVGDTGQTQCFDTAGASRACAGTGEDGELLAGVTWPTPRFTDNGDGTVTDNLTGLIWLKDAGCSMADKTWQAALDWVTLFNTTSIACTDYTAMTFTDWRLPNVRELLSLVDFGKASSSLPSAHPFVNVTSLYWSSTSWASTLSKAWTFPLGVAASSPPTPTAKTFVISRAWPVRGGS